MPIPQLLRVQSNGVAKACRDEETTTAKTKDERQRLFLKKTLIYRIRSFGIE